MVHVVAICSNELRLQGSEEVWWLGAQRAQAALRDASEVPAVDAREGDVLPP